MQRTQSCGLPGPRAGPIFDVDGVFSRGPRAMTETPTLDISKSDVERFLFGKHLTSCPVCGRFRCQCDLDVRTLACERAFSAVPQSEQINIVMVVCQNCGAIQFHDRAVIRQWLDCQKVTAGRVR